MFKKIFLAIFLISFSFANEKLPENFIKTFDLYKKASYERDAKVLWNLQLPYFRYLNKFSEFETFMNARVVIEDIKITKILEKNDEKIKIIIGLRLKNAKNMLYLQQNWYLVSNNYYTILDESMFFTIKWSKNIGEIGEDSKVSFLSLLYYLRIVFYA